ncbi:Na/Pi cotransporter family protein [Synoicihabitans lomoniglobus]|uniref:Na/Pi cotransporter family protein n=1 Tax=Synoicihabitans lomoniglobus TaxID=2909285 RepID=A0AAE9ZVY7_9BACT|nr:Na/Pi cotransporter family protein [Opitutaceae bacterium LMO-M01]WED65221.1 Na/Pi cotransporter family protein [Opitutaceae bacterium LMO-M01]
MISTAFEILGSLGMFLFGMKVMSEALQKLSGERLRNLMRTMTQNRLAGVGTGFLVTCLVQSSSASTVMMVSFVNAGLLTVVEAIGMIMGANLGTTTTFWIVSFLGFKFSLSSVALPIIGVAMPLLFSRRSTLRDSGEFLIGFGLLFLGLVFLKDAVPDIKNNPEALEFIRNYTGHGLWSVLVFFAFGTVLTVIVQSSSVAGAITITMAAKGWIDFPTAAAVILGENVGTTITANLAALSANANAKRAALAHFFFNIIGVIWAVIFFVPLTRMADWIMPGDPLEPGNIPFHMAAFHTGFNLLNIALLIAFVPQLGKLVNRLIKDRATRGDEHLKFDSTIFPQTGELNIAEAEEDVQKMTQLTRDLVSGFVQLYENADVEMGERVKELKQLEKDSDRMARETTDYLLQCSAGSVSDSSMAKISSLMRVIAELEDMCDRGYRLVLLAERRHRKKRDLPAETRVQVRQFSEIVLRFVDFTSTCLRRGVQTSDMETAYQLENFIDNFRKSLRKESIARMRQSGDQVKAEMLYIDILNNMEAIGNHSLNILQALRHHD